MSSILPPHPGQRSELPPNITANSYEYSPEFAANSSPDVMMLLVKSGRSNLIPISLVCLLAGFSLAQADELPNIRPTKLTIERADALANEGKAQEAVDLLTHLLDTKGALEDRNPALHSRAMALMQLKKYDGALIDLEEIMHSSTASHSTKVSALALMVGAHCGQSNFKAIVAETDQLLEMADEKELFDNGISRGYVISTRAFGYLYLNKITKALDDCNEALSDTHLKGSQQALAYHTRAAVYLRLSRFAEASADFQRVLDNPDTQPNIRAESRKYLELVRQQQAATRPSTRPTKRQRQLDATIP